jgi:hypothetical protein
MMPILFIRVLFLIFGWPLVVSLGKGYLPSHLKS